MNECARKKYFSAQQANLVRDAINNKPDNKHRVYTTFCTTCRKYHVQRGI